MCVCCVCVVCLKSVLYSVFAASINFHHYPFLSEGYTSLPIASACVTDLVAFRIHNKCNVLCKILSVFQEPNVAKRKSEREGGTERKREREREREGERECVCVYVSEKQLQNFIVCVRACLCMYVFFGMHACMCEVAHHSIRFRNPGSCFRTLCSITKQAYNGIRLTSDRSWNTAGGKKKRKEK